jgi:hypothetical protein
MGDADVSLRLVPPWKDTRIFDEDAQQRPDVTLREGRLAIGEGMKTLMRVIGVLLILGGAVWFLQGINVIPGSFMTGQIRWAVYGGIAIAAGIALWVLASRRK